MLLDLSLIRHKHFEERNFSIKKKKSLQIFFVVEVYVLLTAECSNIRQKVNDSLSPIPQHKNPY